MSAALLDRRLTPARPDVADERLRDRVAAERFVPGAPRRVAAASAPLRRAPRHDAPLDTEALMGEPVRVFDEADGYAWAQLERDGYVGYLPAAALAELGPDPTHRVDAVRTFVYPGPDLKLQPTAFLSLGTTVAVSGEDAGYIRLASGGFVHAGHLASVGDPADDYVAVAERLLGAPYLWGGKTSLGLDCSGLVQLALFVAGLSAPRDADMQRAALGRPLATDARLQRGDLVFWRGHVGIMQDSERLLHANGHHMAVASEPLAIAQTRIRDNSYGPIGEIRRLEQLSAASRRGAE